jgi:PadR family transcriptional regulator PadR
MILSVLADGPKYGYLMQQDLQEASGNKIDLKAGTLYPILHRLEDRHLVRCRWDESTGRRRKWYSLTAAGRRRLTRDAREWTAHAACLSRLLAPVLKGLPEPG